LLSLGKPANTRKGPPGHEKTAATKTTLHERMEILLGKMEAGKTDASVTRFIKGEWVLSYIFAMAKGDHVDVLRYHEKTKELHSENSQVRADLPQTGARAKRKGGENTTDGPGPVKSHKTAEGGFGNAGLEQQGARKRTRSGNVTAEEDPEEQLQKAIRNSEQTRKEEDQRRMEWVADLSRQLPEGDVLANPTGAGDCLYISLKMGLYDLLCEDYPSLFREDDIAAVELRKFLETELYQLRKTPILESGSNYVTIGESMMSVYDCETIEALLESRLRPGNQGDVYTIKCACNCFNVVIELVQFDPPGSSTFYPWCDHESLLGVEDFSGLFQEEASSSQFKIKIALASMPNTANSFHYMLIHRSDPEVRTQFYSAQGWRSRCKNQYQESINAVKAAFKEAAKNLD